MKAGKSLALPLCLAALLSGVGASASADCVLNAKSKTSFIVLDSHTLILKGGVGGDILIKSFAFFYSSSSVTVLKDSFCDYDSAALYVDGEVVAVNEVKQL